MKKIKNDLFVTSHVARDLLQNAALFKTDKLVVWEYVSNSLQYVDPGINPVVRVTLDNRNKIIIIADNGRGMTWTELQNFFTMHGENIDRKKGRSGRGRFGTGKSAAFGIADVIRIITVRNRKLSKVELRRSDIDSMETGDPVPVKVLEKDRKTNNKNGTMIEIEKVHLKTLDQGGIIKYIEKHLSRWPRNVNVFVNKHECEFNEPPVSETITLKSEGKFKKILGDVKLVIKISTSPLDEDFRGIAIYSKGVLLETTLAGSEGREMSQYIFGEIDVPKLDKDKSPIPPFDLSRSMQLNPSNKLVQMIYAFIGHKVETIRKKLVEDNRRRRESEEAKRLEKQAEKIAQIINDDFNTFRHRIAKARALAGEGADLYRSTKGGGDDDEDLLFGSEVSAEIVSPTGGPGSEGGNRTGGTEPRDLAPQVKKGFPEDDKIGTPTGGKGKRKHPRGGFHVRFDHMGQDAHRAVYIRDERSIYINLDHPQLEAAGSSGSTEDPIFMRLAYEIAFSEYAVALASELAARDEYIDPSDPIVDIRETLNRIARRGAGLFSM